MRALPKFLILALLVVAFVVVLYAIFFGISKTRDIYICRWCGRSTRSNALRVFGVPILKRSVPAPAHKPAYQTLLYQRAIAKPCQHSWKHNFANSSGFLFNSENWDGPLGRYGMYTLSKPNEDFVINLLQNLKTDEDRRALLYQLRLQAESGQLDKALVALKQAQQKNLRTFRDITSFHFWPSLSHQ